MTDAVEPGRWRRALARAASALGLAVVFAGATVGGLVLHLDTGAARRVARDVTNDLLGSLFEGKIIADEIDSLSLTGARIRAAVAVDPHGGQVIRASGIEARADVLQMLRDGLLGKGDLKIEIPYIRIEHADVLVEASPTGGVTIGDAFTPRPSKPSARPSKPKAPPRNVIVALSHIEIGHGWTHGVVSPPLRLDADVNRLTGSVHVGPEGVAVDVEQTGLHDRAFLPAKVAGTANYHLRAGKRLLMWTGYAGQVGAVEVTARGVMDEGYLTASASVPRASPDEVSTLIPGQPFTQPVSATFEIEGDVPTFDVQGAITALPSGATAPTGSVSFEGRLDAGGPLRLDADATVREMDVRLVGAELGLKVDAEGRLRAELSGPPRLMLDARTEPTELQGQRVPAADVHAVLDRGELSGTVRLYEEGMPVDGAFAVLPDGLVRFAAESDIPAIAAAPRLAGGPITGSARVRVEGTVQQGALDARIGGTFGGLRAGTEATLGSGRVEGRVSGPLGALEVDARLSGHDLAAGGYTFEAVEARATGKVTSPQLQATLTDGPDSVRASGRLSSNTGALSSVKVAIRRDGQDLSGTIAQIRPGRGGVKVEGIQLEGAQLGSFAGKLEVRGDDLNGNLRGEAVDLDKLARMLGVPYRVRGIANLEVAVERGKAGRKGKLLLELEGGELAVLTGMSAHISATLEDDQLKADGLVRIVATEDPSAPAEVRCNGTIASVRLSRGEGTLKGPLLRAGTWAGLTGSAEVAAEDWDLRCLSQLVPIAAVGISDLRGKVTTRFGVARAPGVRFPSIKDFVARTRGLQVAGPQGLHDDQPEWESRWIDAQIKGSLDGTTGKAEAMLTAYDGELLGDLSGSVDLDLATLLDQPGRRWASLRSSPIAGRLSIPRRAMSSFKTLPAFAQAYLPPIVGDVRLDVYADGTITRPFLAVRARGFGVSYAGRDKDEVTALAFPTDIDTLITYDSQRATMDAHVSKGRREIATINAEVTAALDDIISGEPTPGRPMWTGGFHAKLDEVPLGELAALGDHDIGGHVSGEIAMSGLGQAPTLTADLELPDLKIGDDLFFERGAVSLRIAPQQGSGAEPKDTAIAKVELVAQDGGRLDATAYAGVRWQDGLVPSIEGGRAADLFARAKRFRLAAVQPLTAGVLSKLDGYVDGDLRIGWSRADEGEAGNVDADIKISGGVVHIPQLGQELRDATLHLSAKDGTVRLDKVSAAGVSGRVEGWALARLNGLELRDAAGTLSIKKGEELPLTLEGVPLGSAYGEVKFVVDKREDELGVDVTVAQLHLKLPATSSRNVQPLDDNPEVAVSHALGPEKERRSPDALRYALTFKLGDVEVEGSGVRMHLTSSPKSPPRVVLADEVQAGGDILLTSGQIEAFGKVFELEQGLVRLREAEASNPYLNVTAYWDAPDGTRVFIDYTGTLKPITNEKLRFRSNPPSSQKDILARLLFDAEGEKGASETPAGQAAGGVAVGVGGELASSQFNTILNGIAPLRGLSTRFGTTSEGTLKTSIVYELDENLTALASYEGAPSGTTSTTAATGTAPGGTASQRTARTELSVDWRFHKNWSLRGTVGVGGAQTGSGILDLLWQYRY